MSTSPWQRGGVGHSQQGLAQDHRQALLQHQAQSSFLYKIMKIHQSIKPSNSRAWHRTTVRHFLQHQAQSSFLYKHHKQYINQSSFCIQTYWYYQDLNCKHIGMFMYCFLTYNLKQIFCLNYWSDPDPRY